MSIQQSEVYECARNTASVKIDNSEWIIRLICSRGVQW